MEKKKGFKRARQIQGISKDAHWYSHLAIAAAIERIEERDLPKIPQSFVELQEKSGGDKMLGLKGLDLCGTGIWPR